MQRNTGAVPIKPETTFDELVPYVRHLAAMLRQYEQVPADKQPPPEGVEITLHDPQKMALPAFPARMRPIDLRADKITVTGANNEFYMQLDYEAVYGGGPLKDLYIASKLYSQYIHFFWEIYPAPVDVQPGQAKKGAPIDWESRWQALYETFNLGEGETPTQARRERPNLGAPVYETSGSNSSTRVRFPGRPGDYVVRCVTGSAPIGKHELKRMSSEAFYPVRVKPIEEEAKTAASQRPEAIRAAEAELKAIETLLAGDKLDESQRRVLLAQQKTKQAALERLRKKETQTLTQNTADEISFATETVAKVGQLKAILPDIIARAKAQGVAPSTLLQNRPELLILYYHIIAEGKTVAGYEQELAQQIEELKKLEKRAGEFQNEFDPASPYQYSPEAALVSQVTGQVYPLVLMLGEAPDQVKLAAASSGIPTGTVYSLVNVTSKQTQNTYYGFSTKTGRAGHIEAINNAFESFGEDASYGEGTIAVRIPPGPAGAADPNYPGPNIRYYESEEGPLQIALRWLGYIAAAVGIAALVATGVGAPAVAGVLGLVAGVAGAITSLHNISERAQRHTLAWDADLALDIIGIIGVVPATAGRVWPWPHALRPASSE